MERLTWHAVDASGRDLATGRPPSGPGRTTPAAALAAAPVAAWPVAVVGGAGVRLSVAQVLGPGGDRVEAMLGALAGARRVRPDGEVAARARVTPVGMVDLPVDVIGLAAGVEAAARVEPGWLASLGRARDAVRRAVLDAGRQAELEAALHLTILLATERLGPAGDAGQAARVASGARLWLLTGAVASALAGGRPDRFAPWASLAVAGWWPVGPVEGRLVVSG